MVATSKTALHFQKISEPVSIGTTAERARDTENARRPRGLKLLVVLPLPVYFARSRSGGRISRGLAN
ncbi:hypothetical protein WAI453_002357 [Rhynchosporium graminicola]